MSRSTGRRCVSVLVSGFLLVGAATAGAADIMDPNDIIRSLAPIEYLPEHSGGAQGPSIDLTIPFALDSAKLKPEARAQLQALGEALASEKLKDQAIEIAGHTDASGKADYNRNLSELRAAAVKGFLVKTFNFETGRFRIVGYGEDELKNPLLPAAAENRRVEISVIAGGDAGKSVAANAPSAFPTPQQMSATSRFDLRAEPAAADAMRAEARRSGSVRVIVGLATTDAPTTEDQGWQNLNDYIRGLQDRALAKLGWVNFNDLVRFEYTPAMAMSVDGKRLDELLATNAVAQVYEDAENAPSLSQSGHVIGISSVGAGKGQGKGVSVAVLDTGVDGNHPFLRGKVVAEACFGTNGRGKGGVYHSSCPSGEGREIGAGAARPCQGLSGCSHGTHVAGIVAGNGDDFAGVAPAANIVAVQVFNSVEGPVCGERGKCATNFNSDIIRGLEWVYQNRDRYHIGVVNLSLGGGRFKGQCDRSPMRRIFSLLRQAGIVVVAASGNDGFEDSTTSPACLSDVVSVGATTYADTVASFSNSAAHLDFLAPGATSQPIGRRRGILSSVPGGRFLRMEGTSMAAPHVAGAFAALKSAVPNATVAEMIEAVRQTGQSVRDSRNGLSRPRIQVDAAIKKLRLMIAARPAEPAPKLKPKPKIDPKPRPVPKSESIDGIRIENGKEPVGEDGKIKW